MKSESLESLYDQALRNLELGDFEQAESQLREFLGTNPRHAMGLNKLGLVYAKQRRLIKAREYFHKALVEDPTLVHALNNLGNIARVEGNLDEAEKFYNQAIEIDPNFSTPHHNLALVHKQRYRFGDYIRERRTAQRLEKQNRGEKNLLREFFLLLRGKA